MAGYTGKRTECTVTRGQFRQYARVKSLELAGMTHTDSGEGIALQPTEFSTGSLGWAMQGKMTLELADGTKVKCQLNLMATVIGSKELPKDGAAA